MSDWHDHSHAHHHHDHDHAHGRGGAFDSAPITDPAQQALVRALRSSFNVLRVLMVILVVLYAFSGVFRVEPGQYGVMARLGKLVEAPNPDPETGPYVFTNRWCVALPDPFDRKIKLPGQVQPLTSTAFMFSHPEAETAKDLASIVANSRELNPGADGAMLTGDRNLSHGRWEVQYRIVDAAKYVRNIGESSAASHTLLARLLETAVLREVASRTVEEVTRTELNAVRERVKTRLQKSLDRLETGLNVVDVAAVTIEPGAVRDAFIDVGRAESERDTLKSEASAKAVETLSRAAGGQYEDLLKMIREYGAAQLRGESDEQLRTRLAAIDAKLVEAENASAGQVAIRLGEARSAATQISEQLRQEYEQFARFLEQRAANPAITLLGLWNQMRADVLGNRDNEVFLVPGSGEIEIHTNRDPQRQLERELQESKKRTGR